MRCTEGKKLWVAHLEEKTFNILVILYMWYYILLYSLTARSIVNVFSAAVSGDMTNFELCGRSSGILIMKQFLLYLNQRFNSYKRPPSFA